MTIEKRVFVDLVEVLEDGQLQVREATQFFEDGIPISSKSFVRKVVAPGDDLAKEDKRVRDIGGVLHTADVIKAHKDKLK